MNIEQSYALVTGGLGFIGSHIARRLLEDEVVDHVVCVDHFGRYTDSTRQDFFDYRKLRLRGIEDRVIIERGEAKRYAVLQELVDKYRPVYVFHLAALPLAKLGNLNTEEAREGTVDSTANLLEIIGRQSVKSGYEPKRFVYASSSMVYGDFVADVATEEHPTKPKEIYGTMKLAGEVVTQGLGRYYGVPYTIIRPSAVYGPTDMNRRVTQIFMEKAFEGETISVDGADEKLDFSYVKDVARGFVLAATRDGGENGVFNITHGRAHTLLDFVMALQAHFPDLKYQVRERDAFRPRRGTLSIEKATRLLGYRPEYTLQGAVDEYVSFVREHHPLFQCRE